MPAAADRASRRTAIALALGVGCLLALAAGPSAATPAPGAAAGCGDDFLGGLRPTIPTGMAKGSAMFCKERYTALASTLTRTGLWSAERLEGWAVQEAATLVRTDSFRASPSLPHGSRAELSDYRGSGLDRGHLTPNGDEPDEASAFDTFELINVVPQAPGSNRGLWEDLEGTVRALARRDGQVYVVTGALFEGADLRVLAGRVYVPTSLWKAVYDPATGAAGVYVSPNVDSPGYRLEAVDAFAAETGIDPFPALPARYRSGPPTLPPITIRRRRR